MMLFSIQADIFFGIIHYQRLRHMVSDQVPGALGGDGGPGDAAANQGAPAGRRRALRRDGEGLAPLPRDHVPAAGPAVPRVGQDKVGTHKHIGIFCKG